MAELVDEHGDWEQGNKFSLNVAKHFASMLSDDYRVIIKYDNKPTPYYFDKLKNIEFALSRETHAKPTSFSRDDIHAIFQNYFMLDKWGDGISNPLAFPLPIGTFVDFDDAPEVKPLPERKYDFSFIGQLPHTGTRDCFKKNMDNMFKEISSNKFNYFLEYTDGFNEGLSTKEYLELLNDSKIVLCPPGAYSLETFRFFEAVKMGAIPMVEGLPKFWYYLNAPFVYSKWQKLDKHLSMSLNFLNSSESRGVFMSVAQYNNTVLNEKALAKYLTKRLEDRESLSDEEFDKQLRVSREATKEYDH